MDTQELTQKAQEYKAKAAELERQKQEINKQLIILEEQYKQYQDSIEKAFQTTDPEELKKIAEGYLTDIQDLEAKLNEQ
jgi:uncharacterized coiled-coil DUF342 family protein